MFTVLATLYYSLLVQIYSLSVPTYVMGDIGQTAQNAYNYIFGFLGGILALMLGYGGYLWMFNHDDASRVNRGKHLVIAAAVGGAFVAVAGSLSTDVQNQVFTR
jgi:hypothetical protein